MSTNNSEGRTDFAFREKIRNSCRNLVKFTSVLSLGTLSSRVLGFFRDVILAKILGTGMAADAFFVAFKIPNLFRDMVGEGATNAALVPVFSEYLENQERKAFWNFVSVVVTTGLIVLSVITVLGIVLAPFIVNLVVPGFRMHPQKLLMTVHLTRLMFPYLVFIGLTAYSMGILFTFHSFRVPAFSPCLLNISLITAAFLGSRFMAEPVFGLAIGVLVGGVLQLAVQIPSLIKIGMRYRLPKDLMHPGLKKIGTLLIPRMIGSGIYQLTVLVDAFCASLSTIVGAGGISAIYYSNRLIQFPMGIFGFAIASAALPTLSGFAAKKDYHALKETLMFSLKNIFFVMCPVTIIYWILSAPIIRALFQRGEFDVYSTSITAWALSFYALGLFSFGGIKILVTAFHSLQDTKTPVAVAALCLAVNAILNFILMYPLKVGGIALASAIAGTIDFLILFILIQKRLGLFDPEMYHHIFKIICASFITGCVMYAVWNSIVWHHELIKLVLVFLIGVTVYFGVCLVLKIEQARRILNWTGLKI